MTLLIGTISDKHAVITADGLSRVNPTTGAGLGLDTFQKVFPVPDLPVAFVHHGFNILGGNPVGEFISDYIEAQSRAIETSSIGEIAEDFRSYTDQSAQSVLANPTNTGVVGFWIVGFGLGKGKPELYEVCWPDKPTPCRHEGIVFGGDAKKFIMTYLSRPLGPFSPDRVRNYSEAFVRQFHQALYKQAEAKQTKAGQVVFGGHKHQLVLKKIGWKWTNPPK